jgi:hypothetical protein
VTLSGGVRWLNQSCMHFPRFALLSNSIFEVLISRTNQMLSLHACNLPQFKTASTLL